MASLVLWISTAVAAIVSILVWRRWIAPWRGVVHLIAALVDRQPPQGFLIRGNKQARCAGLLLEKLSSRYAELESRAASDEFSVRTILTAMPDGLIVVDKERRVHLTNSRFRELFALADGDTDDTLLAVIRDSEVDACVQKAIEHGQSCVTSVRVLRSGHDPREVEVKTEPICENGDTVRGAVVLFREMTQLNRAEQVRRDFVANVSHELRTPLSIFRGYLETLLANPKQPPRELLRIFETMEKHSNRLTLLVEDVLSLAQLEAPDARLHLEKIRLDEWLPAITRDWTSAFGAKQLTLNLDVPALLPPLTADETRLQEIAYNLLDNAVKYSVPGGCIAIRVTADLDFITLCVEDTGAGIARRDLPRIFERFYRADKARSQQIGGTGLGLSIVKHIVQLHQGSVEVASELGQGTKITVRLPIDGPAVTKTLH